MTKLSLEKCKSLEEFNQFLSQLTPNVGKLGGRFFTSSDKKKSYSMNQIVYKFKKIIQSQSSDKNEIIKGCESIKLLEENELFHALLNANDKTITKIQRQITKIRQVIGNFVFSLTHNRFNKKAVVHSLHSQYIEDLNKIYHDKNKLLVGKKPLESAHFSWLLNLGLLRVAEENATSEDQKKQIRFLANNFLNKAAPVGNPAYWKTYYKNLDPQFEELYDTLYQVGPYNDYRYHRENVWESVYDETSPFVGLELNKNLAYGTDTPFVATDSIECSHLFSLKFSVCDENPLSEESLSIMEKTLLDHFSKHTNKPLSKNLHMPLLFDLTHHFGEAIKTGGDENKENAFKKSYDLFNENLNTAIQNTVKKLIIKHPQFAKNLDEFIRKNTICISRVKSGEIQGIKVLPNVLNATKKELSKPIVDFTCQAGLYINAIQYRREVLDAFARREDIHFNIPPKSKDALKTIYYQDKRDFIDSQLSSRLSILFGNSQANPIDPRKVGISSDALTKRIQDLGDAPALLLMGRATMHSLRGLMQEISEEKWKEINQNPILGQVFQASLLMIREHLAMAEMHALSKDFSRFVQEIELIHAEMATLLELSHPFKQGDFEAIYKEHLRITIPEELQEFCQASLGKTAMNTFAGINAALLKQNSTPHRVYNKNIYFEERMFIGDDTLFEKSMKDPQAPPVDLYVGQYNSNIGTNPGITSYTRADINADVRSLLNSNHAAKHLTIAVDCTIEKSPSNNIRALLEEFKEEIKKGQLNFIFFHSGQKFDMLGMDNYYGSPFYIINNGDKQWKPFESLLLNHPLHRADSLSNQWFCLAYKYASKEIANYKDLIFSNTRKIMDELPKNLEPKKFIPQNIKVSLFENSMSPFFIDIKIRGPNALKKGYDLQKKLYKLMAKQELKTFTRGSFGFYHTNFEVFPETEGGTATIRIAPGINPKDAEVIIKFLKKM